MNKKQKNSIHVKQGDTVKILTGKDKGKIGEITKIINIFTNPMDWRCSQDIPLRCTRGSNCTEQNETRRNIQNAKWDRLCTA